MLSPVGLHQQYSRRWSLTIPALDIHAGPGTHVVVDCGFPLVAGVMPRSVSDLGLREGGRVTAVFKASAPHVIGPVRGG